MEKGTLYILNNETSKISITFERDVTCIVWEKNWGIISAYLRNSFSGSEIICDFSKSTSADPFALMNIILDIREICLIKKCKSQFVIPFVDFNREDGFKVGVFLKFLATQGFLDTIMSFATLRYPRSIISRDTVSKISSYKYPVGFSGEVVFPFKIYCLSVDNKDKIVNEVLEIINPRLRKSTSMYAWKHMKEQVYNMICELVDNSYRHAYDEKRTKWIAIYIRRRKGLSSISDLDSTRYTIERESSYEKNNCPGLDKRIFSYTSSFLEVFFSDIGIGMTESLKDYFKEGGKDYKYPVQELYRKVLRDGIRKEYSRAITPFGGLHFICRILKECKGYIWCNEGKEWVGAFANELLGDNSQNVVEFKLTDNTDELYTLGLNWCFRIPFFNQASENKSFSEEWDGLPEMHPVYLTYKNNKKNYGLKKVICIDEFRKDNIFFDGEQIEGTSTALKNIPELTSDISILWLPSDDGTKNELIQKIGSFCTIVSSKFRRLDSKITFVIGDVGQDRLFSFFYAINEQSASKNEFTRVNKIIVVSKKWDIIAFARENEKFIPNKEFGRNYIVSEYPSADIGSNLQSYAQFIRFYDSWCFWDIVKRRKNNRLYINAKINWNKRESIIGFLDLERACLYPDIYRVIENALFRAGGIIFNNSVEYRAVDQTAKRICQGLNSKRSIEDKSKTYIDVCGVSVTGYSFDASYTDSRSSIRFLLFSHPGLSKENDNATLFLWPDKSFFDEFEEEKIEYFRLGKTSLISKDRNETRINTTRTFANVIRTKKEMYEDFQEEIPQILRYGHFKTDNHHYLIGFDVISYMKYSYLKKRGAFVYILWKILYYLIGEDFIGKMDGLVSNEWQDVLSKCRFKKDSNHGALVLYHSNTYTEYIMRKINKVISPSLQEKIIPLSIYEIEAKGSPLTFSPLMLDKITTYFSNSEDKGIMYMDSSFSTGRRNVEIENILLSTDCKKVTFLSLIDMRRLRGNDARSSSYWKINIPRLDDDGHCVLCETLKELNNIKQLVNPNFQERIDECGINWSCMNVNNAVPDHGIESESDLSCDFSGINISNSAALNLYLAEAICESYNNDYVYKYIQSKTDLPAMLRMQLICTQLILYGQQTSRQLQLSLLGEIVKLLSRSKEKSSYTSLGGLVIALQNSNVIYDFMRTVLLLEENREIEIIRTNLLSSNNEDLLLAFAYHVIHNNKLERILNGYAYENREHFQFIDLLNEIIMPQKDLKSIFKEFEGIYINEFGDNHSTNWNKLLKENCKPFSQFETRCNQVINDAEQMCRLIKAIPSALMNSRELAYYDISKLDDLMRELEIEMRNNLNYAKDNAAQGEANGYFRTDSVKRKMDELSHYFDQIINLYYMSYSDKAVEYFGEKIKNISEKYHKFVFVEYQVEGDVNDISKRRYYWNQSIEKEFIYLIQNVEHCKDMIMRNGQKYHMLVKLYFKYDELSIEITSISNIAAVQVEDSFLRKNRLSKEQTLLFDVRFQFNGNLYSEDDDNFLLEVKMRVPSCFQTLKGE